MDAEIQRRHNSVVGENDVVIHIGDFCFGDGVFFEKTARALAGTHFFMDGSHDRAMREFFSGKNGREGGKINLLPKLFEFTFQKTKIVLCHYAMHSWWASHYGSGSVHFHGHSHGRYSSPFQAIDVGVDTNDFYPYNIESAISLALEKLETGANQAISSDDGVV